MVLSWYFRFLSNYERVEIKTDGEPSIVEIARRVQSRRDRTTSLAQSSVGGHQERSEQWKRANGKIQGSTSCLISGRAGYE